MTGEAGMGIETVYQTRRGKRFAKYVYHSQRGEATA